MFSQPNDIKTTYFDNNSDPSRPLYGQNLFYEFLQGNNYHYMVRNGSILTEGIKYYFDNNLCCSICSAKEYSLPTLDEYQGKDFQPKFIRLSPGQPPIVLSTDPEELKKDLEKTFGYFE